MTYEKSPMSFSNWKKTIIACAAACLISGAAASDADAQRRDQGARDGKPSNSRVQWKTSGLKRKVVKPKATVSRKVYVAPRHRQYRGLSIHRRHGPTIYGYGFHYHDDHAARWIAFTAITLAVLDRLDEEQVRYHEQAQIEATTASIGEVIVWNHNDASGTVVALREGADESGYACREFQQTVTVGGEQEEVFGSACLQADGSWRIVD